MDVIRALVVSAASSTAVVVATVFVMRHMFTRWLDHEFHKREKSFDNEQDFRRDILKQSLSIYSEIAELLYRLRNLSREATEASNLHLWDRKNFSEYCYHLTECLDRYRMFLTKETFTDLHRYKRHCQDVVILTDAATRSEEESGTLDTDLDISRRLIAIRDDLDVLYVRILEDIQDKCKIGPTR